MIATSHFHVDWDVNFETKALEGYVIHDLNILVDTDFLTLDSWNNNIEKIEKVPDGSAFASKDNISPIFGYDLDY